MTRSWIHFDEAPFPRIVVPGEASKNRVPRTIRMTKRVEALLREIMENGLVFDVRTHTNDNGGGKVREYRCPARHRIVPHTPIRKSLSSADHPLSLPERRRSCPAAAGPIRSVSFFKRKSAWAVWQRFNPDPSLTLRVPAGATRATSGRDRTSPRRGPSGSARRLARCRPGPGRLRRRNAPGG